MVSDGHVGQQFVVQANPLKYRVVEALHPETGEAVGRLSWEKESPPGWPGRPPTVLHVDVEKPYRRKGLATSMWQKAKEIEPDLQHSHALTPDGSAWVSKLNERGQ